MIEANKISVGLLRQIAIALEVSIDKTVSIIQDKNVVFSKKYRAVGFIEEIEGNYVLGFTYQNENIKKHIAKISDFSTFYLDFMALLELENYIKSKHLQEYDTKTKS